MGNKEIITLHVCHTDITKLVLEFMFYARSENTRRLTLVS